MKLFNSFTEFSDWSVQYADKLETIVEVNEYPDYSFGTVAFMTDKFGGTYAYFNYDFDTNNLVNGNNDDKTEINTLEDLRYYIFMNKIKIEAIRDLNEISNLVNSEY